MANFVEVMKQYGVGKREMNDPFFKEGNKVCDVYSCKGIIDINEESLCHEQMNLFRCDVPNCLQEFDTLLNYELHYNSCHRFTCSECKKQLLSSHLLDLHLSETHDSFFKVMSEKKPSYQCFVESCPFLSKDANERKDHCIKEHKYPHDFQFMSKPKIKPKKAIKKNKESSAMEVTEEKLKKSNKKKNTEPKASHSEEKEATPSDDMEVTEENQNKSNNNNNTEPKASHSEEKEATTSNYMEVTGEKEKKCKNKKNSVPKATHNKEKEATASSNNMKVAEEKKSSPKASFNFSFGHKKGGKTFNTRNVGGKIDMKELMDTLPSANDN